MPARQAYLKRYYQDNRARLLQDRKAYYYEVLKRDPVKWATFKENERLRKRQKFGWKRTYRKRVKLAA